MSIADKRNEILNRLKENFGADSNEVKSQVKSWELYDARQGMFKDRAQPPVAALAPEVPQNPAIQQPMVD